RPPLGRLDRTRRRALSPRLDAVAEQGGRRRLCTGHALLCRPARRGRDHEIDRLHSVVEADRGEPTERPMTAAAIDLPSTYLTEENTIGSWLLTHDHKRIALLFFASITFFFFIGGAAATLIRLHLVNPEGNLLQPDIYNRMFTLHGIVMVWFFLIPSIPTTLGNFLVPLMIGAQDLAFPRLNLTSWYLFMGGGALTLYAIFAGGVDTGWTFYTPFSTFYSNGHVVLAAT